MSLEFQRLDLRDEDWEGVKKIVQASFQQCENIFFSMTRWLREQRFEDKFSELLRMNSDAGRVLVVIEKTSRERHEKQAAQTERDISCFHAELAKTNERLEKLEGRMQSGFDLALIEEHHSTPTSSSPTFSRHFAKILSSSDSLRVKNSSAIWRLAEAAIEESSLFPLLSQLSLKIDEHQQSLTLERTEQAKKNDGQEVLARTLAHALEQLTKKNELHVRLSDEFVSLSTTVKEAIDGLHSSERYTAVKISEFEGEVGCVKEAVMKSVSLQVQQMQIDQEDARIKLRQAEENIAEMIEKAHQTSTARYAAVDTHVALVLRSVESSAASLVTATSAARFEQQSVFADVRDQQKQTADEVRQQVEMIRSMTEERVQLISKGLDDVYPRISRVKLDLACTNRWVKGIVSLTDLTFSESLRAKVVELTTNVWMKTEKMEEVLQLIKHTMALNKTIPTTNSSGKQLIASSDLDNNTGDATISTSQSKRFLRGKYINEQVKEKEAEVLEERTLGLPIQPMHETASNAAVDIDNFSEEVQESPGGITICTSLLRRAKRNDERCTTAKSEVKRNTTSSVGRAANRRISSQFRRSDVQFYSNQTVATDKDSEKLRNYQAWTEQAAASRCDSITDRATRHMKSKQIQLGKKHKGGEEYQKDVIIVGLPEVTLRKYQKPIAGAAGQMFMTHQPVEREESLSLRQQLGSFHHPRKKSSSSSSNKQLSPSSPGRRKQSTATGNEFIASDDAFQDFHVTKRRITKTF